MSVRRFEGGRAALMATILGCLVLTGCSDSGGKGSVKGKVVFPDGNPLTGGTIVFDKTGEDAAESFEAAIEANGEFAVAGGMPPGKYQVGILPAEEDAAGDEEKEKATTRGMPVAEKFSDSATSGLEAEVTDGDNAFTFTVAPPGPGDR